MNIAKAFEIKDHFCTTSNIKSTPIFESDLSFTPMITIAIPTFKRAKLVKDAIDSAINQVDYNDYDIIVVDNDCSRNCETEELLLTYKEPRLSYYKNCENIGMVGNLNRLYMLAKGQYVVELHDDDLLYPDYLSTLVKFLKLNGEKYDAIYPDRLVYNNKLSSVKPSRNFTNKFYVLDLKLNDFLWGNFVGSSGNLYKRQSFIKLGGYNNDFYPIEDREFIAKFAHFSKVCQLSGYPLRIYRISENTSGETEALIAYVSLGKIIMNNILSVSKNRLFNYLWSRCNKANTFIVLNRNKKIFENKEIQINKELSTLGFKMNWIDFFIRWVLVYHRKISFRLRRKKIKIV